MLSHEQVWEAIDALAARHGLSVSGLARRAGLDPTTFNRSKRIAPDGRQRWPSTESIAKILDATGTDFSDFNGLLAGRESKSLQPLRPAVRVPLLAAEVQGCPGFSEGGAAEPAEAAFFPAEPGEQVHLLPVTAPLFGGLYRSGDRLIVSPTRAPRPGDRVLLVLVGGDILAGEVESADARGIRLAVPEPLEVHREDVAFLARILWASQ